MNEGIIREDVINYKYIFLFIFVISISCINDVIVRLLSVSFDPNQIIFFRFLICSILLIPFLKRSYFKIKDSNIFFMNIFRASLGYLAYYFWIKGVSNAPLIIVGIASYFSPIITILLSVYILKEKFQTTNLGIIFIIFCLCCMMLYMDHELVLNGKDCTFIFFLIFSVFLFSMSDVLTKKVCKHNNILVSLFYFNIITLSFSCFNSFYCPIKIPALHETILFFILGVTTNLMLFITLFALKRINLSRVSGIRFLEVFFNAVFGVVFFGEKLSNFAYLILAIIVSTIILYEIFNQKHESSKTKAHPFSPDTLRSLTDRVLSRFSFQEKRRL